MNRVSIGDLTAGDTVDSVFILQKGQLRQARNGPYLDLQFSDLSGQIGGRQWQTGLPADGLKTGEPYHVLGAVESYQDRLQLNIQGLRRVPRDKAPIEEMFPVVGDGAQALAALRELVARAASRGPLRDLADAAFERWGKEFARCTAALGHHHAGVGGLAVHTLAVTRAVDALARAREGVDVEIAVVGAALHDIGKIRHYDPDWPATITDEGSLVGHIGLGVEMLAGLARELKTPEKRLLPILHIVASHHREEQFGALVKPQTREASLVAWVDGLDADDAKFAQAIAAAEGIEGPWTEYHRPLGRSVYRG